MDDDLQRQVFAFLGDPASHGGNRVQRIDTHAAAVFLTGALAFKVKRAVRFPFLDYSTLEKRRQACAAELDVNRRFAPELYRRIVAITGEADGSLAIDGAGRPLEWAVEMNRFDETATLDHLADSGTFDGRLADRLAVAVARAHDAAEVVSDQRWLESLGEILAQNREELCGHPSLFPRPAVEELAARAKAALGRIEPLLGRRIRAGHVRRCHGDLHLGNIVLISGRPVLFDALEFSPDLATIDTLYDLAFLLMDLIERRLDAGANIVLNRYLLEHRGAGDFDGLAALPLFMSVRAAIRAKVTATRLAGAADHQRAKTISSACDYFDLADRLMRPPPASLTAIGGLSGSGKSVLARRLAPVLGAAPGAVLLRSDVERKRHFGVPESQRLPEQAYGPEITRTVYETLARKAITILAAGHAVVVDAVFAKAEERAAIRAVAAAAGVPFQGLFLTLDLATRAARLDARCGDVSDATASIARLQDGYDLGPLDWAPIDAGGTPEETHRRAVAGLKGLRFANEGEG